MANHDKELAESERKHHLGQRLRRLLRDADFKAVFLEGFCKEFVLESVRNASAAIDPQERDFHHRNSECGAHLEAFINRVLSEADVAALNIQTIRSLIDDEDEDQQEGNA